MTATLRGFTNGLPLQVAMTIVGIWAISLWNCVQVQLDTINQVLLLGLVCWQTWLYTGLFITAHDAMHGNVCDSPQINRSIGQLCLWLYAGFDYPQLLVKHHLHHQYPASDRDPDFHNGTTAQFWSWYGQFVCEHISWRQAINLVVMFGGYVAICQLALAQPLPATILKIWLFWILPSLLSSLQLFYFGTFLPHREPLGGYTNPHRATTINRSTWWSLITCYHFGYHREHHESPHLPWWELKRL
jgi:beta-carotene/zeaxanthin 4-ketolase